MVDKRPQDVRRLERGGQILGRRDGTGLMVAYLEQHGFDTSPEALVVGDGWGGKATYVVQERYSDMSQRPHTEDIAGRDLRFETLGHGPEDDMPQAIRVIDPEARSAIYRPLINDGRVVDDKGVPLEAGDSGEMIEGLWLPLQTWKYRLMPRVPARQPASARSSGGAR